MIKVPFKGKINEKKAALLISKLILGVNSTWVPVYDYHSNKWHIDSNNDWWCNFEDNTVYLRYRYKYSKEMYNLDYERELAKLIEALVTCRDTRSWLQRILPW